MFYLGNRTAFFPSNLRKLLFIIEPAVRVICDLVVPKLENVGVGMSCWESNGAQMYGE